MEANEFANSLFTGSVFLVQTFEYVHVKRELARRLPSETNIAWRRGIPVGQNFSGVLSKSFLPDSSAVKIQNYSSAGCARDSRYNL